VWHSNCPSSLEVRVRELCAQVAAGKTETELRVILPEPQAAIQDHIRYLRAIAVEEFLRHSEKTVTSQSGYSC